MKLADEMRRLTENLREAYDGRMQVEVTRQAGAAEAARERARYVDNLRSSVASMRGSVASMRASIASKVEELREEMGEAHRVWPEFARSVRQARAGVLAAPAAPRTAKRGRARRRA